MKKSIRNITTISMLIFLFSCHYIPKKYVIPQNGMYPNYPAKTTFWAKRMPYKSIHDVKRGDIIIYKVKHEDRYFNFVWRVVALPGEVVVVTDSSFSINNNSVSHKKIRVEDKHVIYLEENNGTEYLVAYENPMKPSKIPYYTTTVPENEVFLLGDNRNDAMDSRYNGTVKLNSIIGKMIE